MKKHFLLLVLILSTIEIWAQTTTDDAPKMKQYYFVMLERGPNRNQDSVTVAKIQAGHMANIQRMATEGKCIMAGPFGDDGNWRGIFILDVATIEEAKKEVAQDPAIVSGRLIYEIHPWWTETGTYKFK